MAFDAVVLAGGRARRLGGADKAELVIGGVRLLDRCLAAVGGAGRIVVVGPKRPTPQDVTWTREAPVGAGPVAAVAAGLAHVRAPIVVVLAVDLPFLASDDVARLAAGAGGRDGCVFVDEAGRDQVLAGAYSTAALRAALASVGVLEGASMRSVVEGMELTRLTAGRAGRDCDTWDDVAAARRMFEGGEEVAR